MANSFKLKVLFLALVLSIHQGVDFLILEILSRICGSV